MGDAIWAIPLGFVVGAYGTLIGAGGGFVLMPVLLMLYPGQSPELLTSISLAVVFLNLGLHDRPNTCGSGRNEACDSV